MNQNQSAYSQNFFGNVQEYDDYYDDEEYESDPLPLQVPNTRIFLEDSAAAADPYDNYDENPQYDNTLDWSGNPQYFYDPPAQQPYQQQYDQTYPQPTYPSASYNNKYYRTYPSSTYPAQSAPEEVDYPEEAYHQTQCAYHRMKDTVVGKEYKTMENVGYRMNKNYWPKEGSKIPKANNKKYPVTVKMPRYVNKNHCNPQLNKRPSALSLPVVTQPDPASVVKRKSKTNQSIKKHYNKPYLQQPTPSYDPSTYSAHKMNSEGDVKTYPHQQQAFDQVFDSFESEFANNNEGQLFNATQNDSGDVKQMAKFLKPRVPQSIKSRQDKFDAIKSKTLQPKLKISLDKLLNRLQKCEIGDQISEKSSRAEAEDSSQNKNEGNVGTNKVTKVNSFNYENISRKCSPRHSEAAKSEPSQLKITQKQPADEQQVDVLYGALEKNNKKRTVRPMDDHCALDLHRSKSYIVDLIDRALSKELGTVPRGQSVHHNINPNKAIATISRHGRQGAANHKELSYEVTARLADSVISSATAPTPVKTELNQIAERSASDNQITEKLSEESYIKQLKQLRWGHIRHIQHEVKKLADLEEFLEKCGEIEY